MTTATNSSGRLPLVDKLKQALLLLASHASRVSRAELPSTLLADLREYEDTVHTPRGKSLADISIFEIGFGARPYRLAALLGAGHRSRGVDLDVPLLKFDRGTLRTIRVKNGWERMLKSALRYILFDLPER